MIKKIFIAIIFMIVGASMAFLSAADNFLIGENGLLYSKIDYPFGLKSTGKVYLGKISDNHELGCRAERVRETSSSSRHRRHSYRTQYILELKQSGQIVTINGYPYTSRPECVSEANAVRRLLPSKNFTYKFNGSNKGFSIFIGLLFVLAGFGLLFVPVEKIKSKNN